MHLWDDEHRAVGDVSHGCFRCLIMRTYCVSLYQFADVAMKKGQGFQNSERHFVKERGNSVEVHIHLNSFFLNRS